MKVIVRAPLLSISGYGQHSRQVYEAAKRLVVRLAWRFDYRLS